MSASQPSLITVRFGDEMMEAGFTVVPNLILRHYAYLAITPAEMLFVIHVWEFWWTEREPYPGLALIAERMNMTRRNVRKYVQSLREKGLLAVTERFDEHGQTTSEYDFEPLIRAVLDRSRALGTNGPRLSERLDRAPRNVRSPEEDILKENEDEEERFRIEGFIQSFARDFRDPAPVRSLVSRAINLYQQSELEMDQFIDLLYEARTRTRSATNVKSRAKYFWGVLADLVSSSGSAPDSSSPRKERRNA